MEKKQADTTGVTWYESDRRRGPFRIRLGGSNDWVKNVCRQPKYAGRSGAREYATLNAALTAAAQVWIGEGVHVEIVPTVAAPTCSTCGDDSDDGGHLAVASALDDSRVSVYCHVCGNALLGGGDYSICARHTSEAGFPVWLQNASFSGRALDSDEAWCRDCEESGATRLE